MDSIYWSMSSSPPLAVGSLNLENFPEGNPGSRLFRCQSINLPIAGVRDDEPLLLIPHAKSIWHVAERNVESLICPFQFAGFEFEDSRFFADDIGLPNDQERAQQDGRDGECGERAKHHAVALPWPQDICARVGDEHHQR